MNFEKNKDNKISKILKDIVWIDIIIGVATSLILYMMGYYRGVSDIIIATVILISSLLSALFIVALAEIIQLLHDIKLNTMRKTVDLDSQRKKINR